MAKAAQQKIESETLPVWDLTDFYASPEAPEVKRDLDICRKQAEAFRDSYAGRVDKLPAAVLAKAICEYEQLSDLMGRLGSYAQLLHAQMVEDAERGRFYQNISEALTDISSTILFFTLAINRIEDQALEAAFNDSTELAHYRPWLEDVRAMRPYQLSDELEEMLHQKSVTGSAAWNRLFDETTARLRFPFDGKELGEAEIMDLMSSPDAETRRKAAKSVGEVFGKHIQLFTMITNVLAKDKAIEDAKRGFKRPISSRNLVNQVEDEVVDALMQAVRQSYPRLSHRYYKLKAKWFGQERLKYWDRNAPLPGQPDTRYSWDEAQSIVLDAYEAFSPKLAELGQPFFELGWIDAPATPGKASGAFSHPCVPSVHPYILMNYQGKVNDIMTLAHELGHGVHQRLAAHQGALMADTPLTLAETASVFGEQLTFRAMLEQQKEPSARKAMLAKKVEDMINTVVRQIAFCQFEIRLHDARREGELSPEDIARIWMDVQSESLGDGIEFEEEYQYFWSYIPHFIHTPFYVYAYAFGDCLVNALYAVYQEGRVSEFQQKYLDMLAAGGTLRHRELLAPFGLDASDPAFWQKGLNVISGFIDELEGME